MFENTAVHLCLLQNAPPCLNWITAICSGGEPTTFPIPSSYLTLSNMYRNRLQLEVEDPGHPCKFLNHHHRGVPLGTSWPWWLIVRFTHYSKEKIDSEDSFGWGWWFIGYADKKDFTDGNFSQHGRIIRNAEPHQPVVTNAWDFHWHGLIRFELIKIRNNAYAELKNTRQ